jgi:hypothetical protein
VLLAFYIKSNFGNFCERMEAVHERSLQLNDKHFSVHCGPSDLFYVTRHERTGKLVCSLRFKFAKAWNTGTIF